MSEFPSVTSHSQCVGLSDPERNPLGTYHGPDWENPLGPKYSGSHTYIYAYMNNPEWKMFEQRWSHLAHTAYAGQC